MVLNHKHDWQFVQFPKEFMDICSTGGHNKMIDEGNEDL